MRNCNELNNMQYELSGCCTNMIKYTDYGMMCYLTIFVPQFQDLI